MDPFPIFDREAFAPAIGTKITLSGIPHGDPENHAVKGTLKIGFFIYQESVRLCPV
jgi:hypothetical protein